MDQQIGLSILFIGCTALAIFLFLRAVPHVRTVLWILLTWAALQGALAASGFFTTTDTLPPRMLIAIGPPFLLIVLLLAIPSGKAWIDRTDLRTLTLLHIVRVPVEMGLHGLFMEGEVPQLLTFEGRNFDIFSGLTAPIIAMIAFKQGVVNKPLLLGWNVLCLLLLLNVVIHGILSVPTPFQQFAFDQPNIAMLYFPFLWLPAIIVPLVLLSHLAAIRQLIVFKREP